VNTPEDFQRSPVKGAARHEIISMGDVIVRPIGCGGSDVYTFRTYSAEVRSGQSEFQLQGGHESVRSQGNKVDLPVRKVHRLKEAPTRNCL
jgi:hypothetical protein